MNYDHSSQGNEYPGKLKDITVQNKPRMKIDQILDDERFINGPDRLQQSFERFEISCTRIRIQPRVTEYLAATHQRIIAPVRKIAPDLNK
jgi:hypothetical protein